MSIQDAAEINRALKAAGFIAGQGDPATRSRDLAVLWDAFTRHLFEEVASNGRCAIVARPSRQQAQLFVDDGAGRTLGAFRDPLGIAPAMLALGIERIEFMDGETGEAGGCTASAIEDALRAVLAGGYQPVGDIAVYALGDRFVDAVTGPCLPALPGVTYVIDPALAERESGEITLSEFRDRVLSARTAAEVLDLLRTRVLPFHEGGDRVPFRKAVMKRAYRFNEVADDPRSAIELWTELARSSATAEDGRRVIAVMMAVANKRANQDLSREERDTRSAIAIYEAVLALDHSPEQNRTVLLTMMDVAKRLTLLSGPRERLDVDSAVSMWTTAHRHDPVPESRERTIRSMMEIANKLADTRSPGAVIDIDAAIAIWRAVYGLDVVDEERDRVRNTMMERADDLADPDGPCPMDVSAALLVWAAVHGLLIDDAEDRLVVVKTMMAAANRRIDLSGPRAGMDLDTVFRIWTEICEISDLDDDRARVIRTAMKLASKLVGDGTEAAAVPPALRLWDAAYRFAASGEDRLRVIKTVLDIGSGERAFCREAAWVLDRREAGRLDPRFRALARAGLLYYLEDYAAVVSFVDGHRAPEPSLTALKADALRKLGRLDEALKVGDEVIREGEGDVDAEADGEVETDGNSGPAALDALVSALCCRGYCLLEKGRAGEDTLGEAIEALERAAGVAAGAGIPVQPRIFTGIGYVYRLQGREQEAETAFARALKIDGDNRKAVEAAETEGMDGRLRPDP